MVIFIRYFSFAGMALWFAAMLETGRDRSPCLVAVVTVGTSGKMLWIGMKRLVGKVSAMKGFSICNPLNYRLLQAML